MVAWRQLIGLGIGSDLVKYRLATGPWFRIFPGVNSVGRPADTFRSVWMAAALRAGSGAVLSGRSAEAACGIFKPEPWIEVSRQAGRMRRERASEPICD